MTAISGIGIALPTVDAFGVNPDVVGIARRAEQAGLDHVWVPDHLLFHKPVMEAVTALAFVAGATERIRLGTAILQPALRSPVWLAKQLQTLQTLAPDRLLLGIGVGGEYAPEFEAAGVPVKERGRRLNETLELLGPLMRGEPVSHHGVLDVECAGLGLQTEPPPLLIGGRSEAALKRAAKYGDAFFPMWMSPKRVAEVHAQVAEYAAELGRPTPKLGLVAFANFAENGRDEAATLVKAQYGMPFEKVERWTLLGGPEAIAEQLNAYREAGVELFSLLITSPNPEPQIEQLAAIKELVTA